MIAGNFVGVGSDGRTLGPAAAIWLKGEGNVSDALGLNTPVASGGLTYTAGEVGQAFQFNGTNATIAVPTSTALEPNSVTVEAWVKASGSPGQYRYIVSKGAQSGNSSYALYTGTSGGLQFYIYNAGLVFSPDAGTGIWNGAWHLVAGTYDGGTVRLYVDGVQVGNGTTTSGAIDYNLPDRHLYVGSADGAHFFFGGSIDEVTIFGRPMDAAEVAQIYALGSTGQANQMANGEEGIEVNQATNNTIGGTAGGAGNVLSGNNNFGLWIHSDGSAQAGGNVVQGNLIGVDPTGNLAVPNQYGGIIVSDGVNSGTIGGSVVGAGNIISGNDGTGIYLGLSVSSTTPSHILIQGNVIGLNAGGRQQLANEGNGVEIDGGMDTIGGTAALADNVISGNDARGIYLDPSSSYNLIEGNFIGTALTGLYAVGNGAEGIWLQQPGPGNTIGGVMSTGAGNLISGNASSLGLGNGGAGVAVVGGGTGPGTGTLIVGNYIGLDDNGANSLFNGREGIYIGGSNVTVGGTSAGLRNVIAGNGTDGIQIGNYFGFTTANNLVLGNYIGTNFAGTGAVANAADGVAIAAGSTGNTIGGAISGAGNIISGNAQYGIYLTGSGTSGNYILGNTIGLSASGAILGNVQSGIWIDPGANGNTIGGTAAAARNIISGNSPTSSAYDEIDIGGASSIAVLGNYIGTDPTGVSARFRRGQPAW